MRLYAKKYKCKFCNKVMNPVLSHCPYCKSYQPSEARADALGCKVVTIKCPKCGCEESLYTSDSYMDLASCAKCGETTYKNTDGKLQFKPVSSFNVKCPYCGSTSTKKISSLSKAAGVAVFGVFAIGKTTKQWHCNNCKSDF